MGGVRHRYEHRRTPLQKEAPSGGVVVTDVRPGISSGAGSPDGRSGCSRSPGSPSRSQRGRSTASHPVTEWDDLPSTSTVLIGREREREFLADLWRDVVAGATHFVLLRGEPGVGKSRLTRYWRDTVASAGATVVVAPGDAGRTQRPVPSHCERSSGDASASGRPTPATTAWASWHVGCTSAGSGDDVRFFLIAPLLGIPLDSRYEAPALSPARRRNRLIEVLTSVLVRLCCGRAHVPRHRGPALGGRVNPRTAAAGRCDVSADRSPRRIHRPA